MVPATGSIYIYLFETAGAARFDGGHIQRCVTGIVVVVVWVFFIVRLRSASNRADL